MVPPDEKWAISASGVRWILTFPSLETGSFPVLCACPRLPAQSTCLCTEDPASGSCSVLRRSFPQSGAPPVCSPQALRLFPSCTCVVLTQGLRLVSDHYLHFPVLSAVNRSSFFPTYSDHRPGTRDVSWYQICRSPRTEAFTCTGAGGGPMSPLLVAPSLGVDSVREHSELDDDPFSLGL